MKTTSAAVWQNWAGTARCRPSRILRPSGDEEIAEAIGAAAGAEERVRVAGSGHSLQTVEEPARVEDVLASFEQRIEENEHFEFFWFPHTNRVLTKANNRTDRPPSPKSRRRAYVDEILLANRVYGLFCRAGRRWPPATPRLARLVGALLSRAEEVDRSDRVFTSPRLVRFAEMEYAIPRASMADAFREVRTLIQRAGFRVSFPVEVRAVAADDIPLSPSFGRVTAYIAVHMFQGVEYEPYFRGVEAIMHGMGGRPHWGKLHFRTAETLRPAYPEWDRFTGDRGWRRGIHGS